MNDFITKLQGFSYGQSQIDQNLIRDVSLRFPGGSQQGMVNYIEFIRSSGFEFEKFKLIDVIFLAFQEALSATRAATLKELFSRLQPLSQPQIDKPTLDNVLKTVSGVQLQPYELDMVILEYESTKGRNMIDFDAFDKDFREFQTGKS